MYFMFENVDRVHGRFLQYTLFKAVVGRILSCDLMEGECNCSLPYKINGKCVYVGK